MALRYPPATPATRLPHKSGVTVQELIKIDSDQLVDARELHAYLGVGTTWNTWIGRRKVRGIHVGKVGDERHGFVNSYPMHVLRPLFEDWRDSTSRV